MTGRAWHSLLQRQLRRLLGDSPPPPEWRPLLDMVSRAYEQADADRRMLERSLDLSSQELLQANRDLRSIFSLLPDMFFRVGPDGIILDANMGAFLGERHQSDLRGIRLCDAPPECCGRALIELIDIARGTDRRIVREMELRVGGAIRHAEVTIVPLRADEHVIFVRDITARRLAEEEIRRLAAAVEQATDAVLITDPAGIICYVNPAFEHILGYSRDEVLGKTPSLLKSGRHDSHFYERLWGAITSGRTWKGRLTDRRKDGALVELYAAISPVRDSTRRIVNYVAVSHDVTREAELQDQLRQAQKMEAIGRLAGGIAHDFNNLLTAMMGNADLALRRIGPDAPAREDVEQIREAAQKTAGLINQLLAFSRKQVVNPRVISINDSIWNLSRMLRRIIGPLVRIETDLDPQAGLIRIDPVQLEQVIMNLALNARDAMPDGGILTLRTRMMRIDQPDKVLLNDLGTGLYAVLEVADTGIGMDAQTQARIFEPFFTTKEVGRGTGLGLATVYGIVRQCGGAVRVESAPGKGASFFIYFPQARAALATAAGAAPPKSECAQTVLLVDDEAPMRKLIGRLLIENGFTVIEAFDGEEALDVLRRNAAEISLLLTDVAMPRLDGQRLAEIARAEFPRLPIILMSGRPETAHLKSEDLSGIHYVLRKPFRAEQLVEAIDRALRTDAPAP